jgi:hypothetical protein
MAPWYCLQASAVLSLTDLGHVPQLDAGTTMPGTTTTRFRTQLRTALAELHVYVAGERLRRLLWKYRPDQPRVPAGVPEGGQWTEDGTIRLALNRDLETECWEQYERDRFHCSMVGLASCYRQAAERYAACLREKPLPPLNY